MGTVTEIPETNDETNEDYNNKNIALGILNDAIDKLKAGDAGAHFEKDAIAAAIILKNEDMAEFMRKKREIKNANKNASITEWSDALKTTYTSSSADDTTQAGELAALATSNAQFFHDSENKGYAAIEHDDHIEYWSLESAGFNDWLTYKAYKQLEITPNDSAIKQAINALNSKARFDGEEHEVWMRCAPYKNGYIIDLVNDKWQVAQVDASGYRVLDESPVRFKRSNTAESLPIPEAPNLSLLWKYANFQNTDKLLVLAFMLESFRPKLPFTILGLVGEHGSGKSSAHKAIRALTDPNKTPLRAAPKNIEDIQVTAMNNWQISCENVSFLKSTMQDALCYFSTGGGSATRKLYTNADEATFEAMCPIIINSIDNVITRHDLIDRSVILDIPRISKKSTEKELIVNFKKDKPLIFAGLMQLFSLTLNNLPDVEINDPPRMIDFAHLGEAMMKAIIDNNLLDAPDLTTFYMEKFGSFNALYKANHKKSLNESLAGSPATIALTAFIDKVGTWEGTVGELLTELEVYRKHTTDGWPKSPLGLAHLLKRTKPALRLNNIEVIHLGHKRDGTHIKISFLLDSKNSENNRHILTKSQNHIKNDQNEVIL